MKMKINFKKTTYFLLLSIIIKILYDNMIIEFMPSEYMYGITYGVFYNSSKMVLGWVFFLMASIYSFTLIGNNENKLQSIMITFLYYLYYLPGSSAYYLNNSSILFLILFNVLWILLCSFLVIKVNIARITTPIKLDSQINNRKFIAFALFICASSIVYAYRYNGLNFTISLLNVYNARAAYVGTSNLFTSFLLNFGGNIVVPIFIIYSLKHRKIVFTLIGVLSQIALYSIAMEKGKLLLIGIAFGIYIMERFDLLKKVKELVPIIVLLVFLISFTQIKLFENMSFFMIFVRRMFYFPAWLNTLYFSFFQNNELLLWTQDIAFIKKLGFNRYSQSVLTLINNTYFGGNVPSPNNGLFSEVYMHFGFLGPFIYPFIYSILINLLLKYVSYYDLGIRILMVFTITKSLISIPITSGIFIMSYMPLVFITIFIFGKYKLSSKKVLNNVK